MSGPVLQRLVLARHGVSLANVEHRFANRGSGPPLTAAGVVQAVGLAESLRGQGIGAVVCSPLLRAAQTAGIVADRLSLTVEVEEALREYDVGACEGSTAAADWAEYERTEAAWDAGDKDARTGGGESLRDVEARVVPWFERLRTQTPAAVVLAVTHGGLLRRLLAAVLRPEDVPVARAVALGPASWLAVDLTAAGGPVLEMPR